MPVSTSAGPTRHIRASPRPERPAGGGKAGGGRGGSSSSLVQGRTHVSLDASEQDPQTFGIPETLGPPRRGTELPPGGIRSPAIHPNTLRSTPGHRPAALPRLHFHTKRIRLSPSLETAHSARWPVSVRLPVCANCALPPPLELEPKWLRRTPRLHRFVNQTQLLSYL